MGMKKVTVLILMQLTLLSSLCLLATAQDTVTIAYKRFVIPSYVEPNTPGAPGVLVDQRVADAITDPAAKSEDGSLDLNKAIYVRFFDATRSAAPEAIVVLIPEKSAGAGSFRLVAKEIVANSGGRYEVWVIDHRSSLMEDVGPMVAAENAKTLSAAFDALRAYQNHPAGRGGFLANNPALLSGFMSEWGLDVFLRDIKSVVEEARKATPNVYLGGHSQGADLTQMFAGYDFGDTAGYELLSGMILLDGTADPVNATPISDATYLNGGQGVSGLNQLRASSVPPFAVEADGSCSASLFQVVEAGSQIALLDPQGPTLQRFLPQLVRFPATNNAFMGLILDDEFQRVPIARLSVGFLKIPTGGSAADVATRVGDDPAGVNPNGLWTPKDPGTGGKLDWVEYKDLKAVDPTFVSGKEVSSLKTALQQSLLISAAEGKIATNDDANSNQWYFPVRLVTDMQKVSDLGSTPLSAQVIAAQQVRGGNAITLTESAKVNIALLAIRAKEGGVIASKSAFNRYKKSTRIRAKNFATEGMNSYTHADLIVSLEKTSATNQNVPELIVDFIDNR